MLNTPQSTITHKRVLSKHTIPTASRIHGEKIIFLTFDDGPLNGTKNVLKVLQKEKVPATMFMVGKHIRMNQKLYKNAIHSPYVTIANHTYSHAGGKYRKFYNNKDKLLKDVKHTNDIMTIDNQSNINSPFFPLRLAGRNVFRLPCISCDDLSLGKRQCKKERPKYDTLSKAGFFIYGWDLEWGYSPKDGRPINSAKEIVKKLENIYASKRSKQQNKVILLMHDFMFRDRFSGEENLLALIALLKKSGWKFAGIEEYI